jgi:DNA polymerase-3 subunit epsilon
MFKSLRRRWHDRAAVAVERWVVIDVETTGLDSRTDELIAVAGVAMAADGSIVPRDSLELVVRPLAPSGAENILVHGIGAAAQRGGAEPAQAMTELIAYVSTSPLVAFHAPFDRGFIERAVRQALDRPLDNPWLDLAKLAPALEPRVAAQTLDEWLDHCGIEHDARHSAAADAFATAQLAAALLARARRQGATSFTDLQKLARSARWVRQ